MTSPLPAAWSHQSRRRRGTGLFTAGLATAIALVAVGVPGDAAQAGPKAPTPITITFPGGPTADNGSTVSVVFDANGNPNVTGFRYSVTGAAKLTMSASADAPGGTATVALFADHLGALRVHVGDQDNLGSAYSSSPIYHAEVQVVGDPSLSGTLSLVDHGPRAGVTVTLEPGGLTALTDADGYYRFDHLTPGAYTLHTRYEQGCDLALDGLPVTIPVQFDQDLWLPPVQDGAGYRCFTSYYHDYEPGTTVRELFGDDAVQEIGFPFDFPFYGQTYSSVWVDSNGYLSFTDQGGSHQAAPADFPSANGPHLVVAPYWDDLIIDPAASVRTTVISAPGYAGALVVDWHNVAQAADPTTRFSFSVTLYASDGYINVAYAGLTPALGSSDTVTVGIAGPGGGLGIRYDIATEPLLDARSITFHNYGL
ncbi:carboxypeptidase-like regulatory domain-containing protein [Micromonospora sp. LOL_023]|uniref:carboxypeptidase-like regulatory domain-containing protein n=1 Tax=Micromonospora sp. LOL_023 TaxID=3345418 RepID=UPI003A88755B